MCALVSAICLSTFLLVLGGDGPEIPKLYPLTLGFLGFGISLWQLWPAW
jgi:hypothetical protein